MELVHLMVTGYVPLASEARRRRREGGLVRLGPAGLAGTTAVGTQWRRPWTLCTHHNKSKTIKACTHLRSMTHGIYRAVHIGVCAAFWDSSCVWTLTPCRLLLNSIVGTLGFQAGSVATLHDRFDWNNLCLVFSLSCIAFNQLWVGTYESAGQLLVICSDQTVVHAKLNRRCWFPETDFLSLLYSLWKPGKVCLFGPPVFQVTYSLGVAGGVLLVVPQNTEPTQTPN